MDNEQAMRRQIENTILVWSTEISGQRRDALSPEASTLVDRFIELITQRDKARELAARQSEAKRWEREVNMLRAFQDAVVTREQLKVEPIIVCAACGKNLGIEPQTKPNMEEDK